MYLKNLNCKMTIRFDERINNFITEQCELLGLSPSEFVRVCLNTCMYASAKAKEIPITETDVQNIVNS